MSDLPKGFERSEVWTKTDTHFFNVSHTIYTRIFHPLPMYSPVMDMPIPRVPMWGSIEHQIFREGVTRAQIETRREA